MIDKGYVCSTPTRKEGKKVGSTSLIAYPTRMSRHALTSMRRKAVEKSPRHSHMHMHNADDLDYERDFFFGFFSKEASNTDLKQQRRGGAPNIHIQANYAV